MALKYETKTPILGIDVSKYQGNVDWAQVKAAGYAFAFVRLGYANGDGSIVEDPCFEQNLSGAAAAGLDVGVYLYSYIDSEDHARIAAARALELLAGRALSLPLVLDYEHAAKYKEFSRAKNTAICNAFMACIAAAGYLPMFYSYTSFVNSYMDMETLDRYEGLWIANYTGKIGVDNTAVWQYSSSGAVPGVQGRCDLNRMYCDLPRIIRERCAPGRVEFQPLTGKQLEVFDASRCEYFTAPDINAVVLNPDGKTDKLPESSYKILTLADGLVDGYPMVQIEYRGETVYSALLDDRCRIIDVPEEGLELRLCPVPNEGDRKSIEAFCKNLGFSAEFIW